MPRPRIHDRDRIVKAVCARISKGELVNDAAKAEGTTGESIREWQAVDPTLSLLYARARESQAHALAEETLRLADSAIAGKDGNTDKVRLQVDTRKWYTSKLAPKLYGDKLDVTSAGEKIGTAVIYAPPEQPA